MTRLLSTLALGAVFALTGCDSAPTAAQADGADAYGECSRNFTIFGPSTVAPGQSANFVANMEPGCAPWYVEWSITSGNATITGTGGLYGAGEVVTVKAGSSGSFTLRAIVESAAGVAGRSKTVAIQ